ncbi:MAG TPA: M14 family zinc carboxypeptidase [Chitinophagaceae bacterium]|nr:M14 family zinc carboxypeptidase [Chitinophagaceae bacterium]
MKIVYYIVVFLFISCSAFSQQTPFEKSNGRESATYFQAIEFYKNLDKASSKILMKEMGPTDAGYPLNLVLVSNDGKFDPEAWHKQNKVVILINNGIHPGEPDGIDASMMLVRDIIYPKKKTAIEGAHHGPLINEFNLPDNVVLTIIPVYNIGGSLNRNSYSRANQNGPLEYGFRGNSQNLDLNRDFTKNDSKESRSFVQVFHYLNPDILIDNHVSDGADYQYTMTMLTTQYDKLGADLGYWLKEKFEPELYKSMKKKGWEMTPYVNFETAIPDSGMLQFYDPPRYSSGYAALFQTIGFVPETHMLKPFADRVRSTFAFMQTVIEESAIKGNELIAARKKAQAEITKEKNFPLSWQSDSSKYSTITFKGYDQAFKTSDATGLQRMYYDHKKPFTKQVKFFDVFIPKNFVTKPEAYIIPQGWWAVIDLLKLNKVQMLQLKRDTTIEVEAYHFDDYRSSPRPYEKHHRNTDVKVSASKQKVKFLKGDYIIPMNQAANRYIVEMLEPTGDDSFFSWNFFDAILQQKEGYSDYRWEDVAAEVLKNNPDLKQKLEAKKKSDSKYAKDASAQLNFIYKNSPYSEPGLLRYPVYRLIGNK